MDHPAAMASDTAVRDQSAKASPAEKLTFAEIALDLKPQRTVSAVVIAGLWRLAEALLIIAVGGVVYWHYVLPQIGWQPAYAVGVPCFAAIAILSLTTWDSYEVHALRAPVAHAPRLAAGWAIAFLVAFMLVFFMKLEGVFSRVFMAAWFVAGGVALAAARALLSIKIRRMTAMGLLDRRTAVVGGGEAAERLLRELGSDIGSDLRILGVFDDRHDDRSPDVIAGHPKLGTVDDLVAYARHVRLDLVIFALPISAETRILQMLKKLWVLPIDIRLAAHAHRLRFKARNYSYIGQLPVLDMMDKPLADWNVVLKWMFDKTVGSLLLIALSPILLAVAIAVKLSSKGPVIFRQKRYGFNNELIEVYKFRSMYVDQADATASKLVTRGDPRVTPV
ncbi:MAG: sugar transferase, partial [Beijerinckiaceae bacterium]